MTITKERLIKQIETFSDEISINEVIERLIIIEKLELKNPIIMKLFLKRV
ncbi:hypothetical protein [Kaistella sp.]